MYVERCRKLRANSTDAEKLLWYHIRAKRLYGYKFRRQKIIGFYIVDFICCESKITIELDGSQHLNQQDYDQERTKFLNSLGYYELRFWNNQV